jgi:hypothetical protein
MSQKKAPAPFLGRLFSLRQRGHEYHLLGVNKHHIHKNEKPDVLLITAKANWGCGPA